jgi:hypothetical protein
MIKEVNEMRTRAQESRAAIERLYVAMRHLFIRGVYKPLGVSGEALIEALMVLRPEIYGSIADPERVELDGLLYIFERLPKGIEECRFIKLVSREGFEDSSFSPIVAEKRKRDCYRIDKEEIFIEMTRGRSDIYDIMTHLTFMYVEAEKIRKNSITSKGSIRREWEMLEKVIKAEKRGEAVNIEIACTYLSSILCRTYNETISAVQKFAASKDVNSLFHIVYWLGYWSMEEAKQGLDREITFSSALREKVGHHIFGELWANNIKRFLFEKGLLQRPLHIISANLHSVMNTLYFPILAGDSLTNGMQVNNLVEIAQELSLSKNDSYQKKLKKYALENGMYEIEDISGTNLWVQIFDTAKMDLNNISPELEANIEYLKNEQPVIFVMDYAFGEQAFETMDELLKPFEHDTERIHLNIQSISIMGKAGILKGKKGDIMIPNAHIFEGTADNYPFKNDLKLEDFKGYDSVVANGPMISVLGTSLQNKDILMYFFQSSWQVIGLEMEGAHYQKAIQAASQIRNNIKKDVTVRYAYYASDNPLISGQTLASGSLGMIGVRPTYVITREIMKKILA